MKWKHKELAEGRWGDLSIYEQMANIGAEVGRAINWREKGDEDYALQAFYRALELIDFTIMFNKKPHRLREITRMRELLADYFVGDNIYRQTAEQWNNYFYPFNYAARKEPVKR